MEYYRSVYFNSILCNDPKELENKIVIIYCQQGFGDVIQFARHFKELKELGCETIVHCPKELHCLLERCDGVDKLIDKEQTELPEHDFHVLSMHLPFILANYKRCLFPDKPYIYINESIDLETDLVKIGIVWEGNPKYKHNLDRSCPLKHFKKLQSDKTRLFSLQKEIYSKELLEGCEDLDLFSVPLDSFVDTAKLINSVDFVVCVDTAVLHLAGALGKKGYGAISYIHDFRWNIANWYPSITVLKQDKEGNWDYIFDKITI